MPDLSELSPHVREVLNDNHFVPQQLLRYGPRFAIVVVDHGSREGLFKMVLPLSERELLAPKDYVWTEYDEHERLESRLLKEALFLQFFSQELDRAGFEPQIIALSETSPVWSLRSFINERTMSAWGSDFVFSPRFFTTFEPATVVDFFERLHALSPIIPRSLTDLCKDFTSTLLNRGRFTRTLERAAELDDFKHYVPVLEQKFDSLRAAYSDYRPVITHYEPYPPHIFASNGRMGLIDWENVGWGHQLQDLSVLWMRCFTHPEWQDEYLRLLQTKGYFDGNGQLFWDSEMLIQGFANHAYFANGGPIGTPEYDAQAITFFEATVRDVLDHSRYFVQ